MPYIRIDLAGYEREPGFCHFEIWRHTADIVNPNSPPERVTRSATRVGEFITSTRFEDTSAVSGVTYWYWARAMDRYGNTSPFLAVGTIMAPPANIKLNSDRLLGRDTAGKGDVEEIALTGPLQFDGAKAVEIAAQGVTFADHVQHVATGKILGRTSASDGPIEQLDLKVDADGNVGIGTTTPVGTLPAGYLSNANSQLLAIKSKNTTGDAGLLVARSDNLAGAHIWQDSSAGNVYVDNVRNTTAAATIIRMRTTGTPVNAIAILGAGDVGIGTTSPGQKLHVDGVLRKKTYTVATLPSGAAGDTSFASDGCKAGESTSAGTGVPVYHDGTAWRRYSDDTTVVS